MFKTYKQKLPYSPYLHRYTIVDDDFEEVVEWSSKPSITAGQWEAIYVQTIMDCYTKRKLPVAPNLFRFMLEAMKDMGWSLETQYEWQKKYNPRWHEVEKDMQMYLLFS